MRYPSLILQPKTRPLMAIAEILSRLNNKSNIFDPLPSGGRPAITEHDIAAALGMSKITPGAAYLLRVKWCKQMTYLSDLTDSLYAEASGNNNYSILSRKRSHYPGLVYDLSKMAVSEYCLTSTICQACEGRREAVIDAKVVKCGECGGSGAKNQGITRQELIEGFLRFSHMTFYRTWRQPYDDMIDLLSRWEQTGLGAVHNRLYQ